MYDEVLNLIHTFWIDFLKLLPRLVFSVIVLILFVLFSGTVGNIVKQRLESKTIDRLRVIFLGKVASWIFIITGFVISMEILGLAGLAGGIITGAGISAVILGFAFKNIGENFLSGLLLAFKRPFKIGDMISVDKFQGTISSLDFRSTNIKTIEGHDVFIPNSIIINSPLINYTFDSRRRFEFTIQIDFTNDISKAKSIILNSILRVKDVLRDPNPLVIVDELTTAISIRSFYWVDTSVAEKSLIEIKSEVMEYSREDLNKEGIFITDVSQIRIMNDSIPLEVKSNK